MDDNIVIVSAARTPIGAFQGVFAGAPAPELGAAAIKAALDNAKLTGNDISEVLMGCVLPAGLGQAPARQAAIKAGIHNSVPATTVNKMCGSGMKTVALGAALLKSPYFFDKDKAIVAGGLESMTNAPYILPRVRQGLRLGHSEVKDHMFLDGLEDAYHQGQLMGVFAELTAKKFKFTRQEQDEFAMVSLERAQLASKNGDFAAEITPVMLINRGTSVSITTDEIPGTLKAEKIPTLRPAFAKDGTVTAANSSSIADGAAAVVLMTESAAKQKGLRPLARIKGIAAHAQEPEWFTTAPITAISKLLQQISWRMEDVDLFEINEAFAVVTMAAIRELSLSHEKVNVRGGACALGHPIGASGTRILVTLLASLHKQGLKRGVASLCIGGGEALAMAVEML